MRGCRRVELAVGSGFYSKLQCSTKLEVCQVLLSKYYALLRQYAFSDLSHYTLAHIGP